LAHGQFAVNDAFWILSWAIFIGSVATEIKLREVSGVPNGGDDDR
jgi:hypothetical protein